MNPFTAARWIWTRDAIANQYLCFRKKFRWQPQPSGPTPHLYLAVDSDFMVWLNGIRLEGSQFTDWPETKTYTVLDLAKALVAEENTLAILAYYRGHEFQTYTKGRPGLIAAIPGVLDSGADWSCLPHPAFTSGMVPVVTSQLGFTIACDARRSLGDWQSAGFDDAAWSHAVIQDYPAGYRETLTERPLPPLRCCPPVPVTLVMQGLLKRDGELETFAQTLSADWLQPRFYGEVFQAPERIDSYRPVICPPRPGGLQFRPLAGGDGYFVVVDLGRETAGMIQLDLTASAGTVCDIAVGEHLEDGRVRARIGNRNFTDRYVCRDGRNRFEFPFRRAAGRYLELHLTGMTPGAAMTLDYLGLAPVEIDLPADVGFECDDQLANRTHAVAARTLQCCMHDHYEDCPWREQALYAYDSRNQALYGYYLWGNYRFAAASLDLLGQGLRPDGLLQLCAPCRMDLTIPIFSYVWVSEIAEYLLHSGDRSLAEKYCGQIGGMIEKLMPLYDEETGLFRLHDQKYHWHFYEWSPGLDGTPFGTRIGVQAGANLYGYEMLGSYLEILRMLGRKDDRLTALRRRLGQAIHTRFWDEEKQCYASTLVDGRHQGFHEHIQALALYNNLVPSDCEPAVLRALYRHQLTPLTFSVLPYLVRALMERGPEAREFVRRTLKENFDPVVLSGATSLWETAKGAADFDDAGSLCHAWSSISLYYDHAYGLGIRPLEPGFARFGIAPCAGKRFSAQGTVATPKGAIRVHWTRQADGLTYEAEGPDELLPELRPYPEFPVKEATYNGRLLTPIG